MMSHSSLMFHRITTRPSVESVGARAEVERDLQVSCWTRSLKVNRRSLCARRETCLVLAVVCSRNTFYLSICFLIPFVCARVGFCLFTPFRATKQCSAVSIITLHSHRTKPSKRSLDVKDYRDVVRAAVYVSEIGGIVRKAPKTM